MCGSAEEGRAFLQQKGVQKATGALLRRVVALCTLRHDKGRPPGGEYRLKAFLCGQQMLLLYGKEERTAEVRSAMLAVVEVMERIVREGLAPELTARFLPALRRFHAVYDTFIPRFKALFLLDRLYELAALHVRLRLTPRTLHEDRSVLEATLHAKSEALKRLGGDTALQYVVEVVQGVVRASEPPQVQGPYMAIPRDAHALALDPSLKQRTNTLTRYQEVQAERVRLLGWELICAQLTQLAYSGGVLAVMRQLRCAQRLDLSVIKDLIEGGMWSMKLNDDLMEVHLLQPQQRVAWQAFVAARKEHRADAPWELWLCVMLQFLVNAEQAEALWAESGQDVVQAERALFVGRPTPITKQWLQQEAAKQRRPLATFQRAVILDLVLTVRHEDLPEILALDRPHIYNMRVELQRWSTALAMLLAVHSDFDEAPLVDGFAAWLVAAPEPINNELAAARIQGLCWTHVKEREGLTQRVQLITSTLRELSAARFEGAASTVIRTVRCLVEGKPPPECPLLASLSGAMEDLRAMSGRLRRLVALQWAVHQATYAEALA